MMPPECCICDKDFPPQEGGLIYFEEDEHDKVFNKRFEDKEIVGHPSNAFWFCEKHYPIAKNFMHLTKKEAFKEINRLLK